jgi:ABC-2 type transport system ATP-binding protein
MFKAWCLGPHDSVAVFTTSGGSMTFEDADHALSIRGLTKSYGDVIAVRDLSIDVCHGETLGFLGPNGAGKTTTVGVICGLLAADSGEVTVHGHSLTEDYARCKQLIGLCPQDVVIWESLTCMEQVTCVGQLYDLDARAARSRAHELLEIMGLSERRDKLASTLSGGMKRRLNITLALVHEPSLLILDEPQAGLDPQSRVLVREYVRSLANTTVILTTHDMDEADRMADRVAIIDHGQLLVLDTPDNLKSRVGPGDVLEIRVGEGQDEKVELLRRDMPEGVSDRGFESGVLCLVGSDILNLLSALLEKFRHHDVTVEDTVIRKTSLEDVFIGLTGRRLRE